MDSLSNSDSTVTTVEFYHSKAEDRGDVLSKFGFKLELHLTKCQKASIVMRQDKL
jgi:hypothetical protein